MALDYATIVKQANEVLAQYSTPLTLRQLYYQLVALYGLPNRIQSYKSLGAMLVRARENGDVNWTRIEDRIRETLGEVGFSDESKFRASYADGVEELYSRYRRNLWLAQGTYIEVWLEKDALSRIFSDTTDEFVALTCPSRGYSSLSFLMEAAQRLRPITREGKREVHILHFSDFDPSGLDMFRDLGDRLARYGAGSIKMHRIALTPEQIRKYRLPPAPVKTSDSRAAGFVAEYGADVVELDALNPRVLQNLIRESIRGFITNKAQFQRDLKRMAEEQEELKAVFEEAAERIREG